MGKDLEHLGPLWEAMAKESRELLAQRLKNVSVQKKPGMPELTFDVTRAAAGGSGDALGDFVNLLSHSELNDFSFHKIDGRISCVVWGKAALTVLADHGLDFPGCSDFKTPSLSAAG